MLISIDIVIRNGVVGCLFLAWLLDHFWFLVRCGRLVVSRDGFLVVSFDSLLGKGSVLAGLGTRNNH